MTTLFTAAYFGKFEEFYELYKIELKEYEKFDDHYDLDDMQFLSRCIVRGVTYNFEFARKLHNSDLALSERICRAISGRFIMSNYLEEEFIKPFCIWYPDVPSKETCVSIAKKFPQLVGIVCVLMNWNDIYDSLNIYPMRYIYNLARLIDRTHIAEDQWRKSEKYNGFFCFYSRSPSAEFRDEREYVLKDYLPIYNSRFHEESLMDYCNYNYFDSDEVCSTGLMGWNNLSQGSFEGNLILDNVKTHKFKQIDSCQTYSDYLSKFIKQ
ncbi:uncharacterized protein AC631_05988 [Debaryomyces fabryi]|uniref:Uncharacterized protein n=1 Tax=Debaryomyces fabryi TaxID=58627 RepID=A0A0V1PPS1_9ASCO|nr:uncharacterized protein AC631_05988 [Debaryomyces fabryi]KRZ98252.1 hypothetical protein AC631_05988 [Debaryomyces fabryi]